MRLSYHSGSLVPPRTRHKHQAPPRIPLLGIAALLVPCLPTTPLYSSLYTQYSLEEGELDAVYAAITLGCPALEVTQEARDELSTAERLTYGYSNYIDTALAAVFLAAYKRGLLNVRSYLATE